jgi:LacI family transcriptional regulator
MTISEDYILQCSQDDEMNKSIIAKMLKKKNRPNGIFASVEKLALISYEVCNELNLKIPEDVKVIGFSNLYTAGLLNPSLTTITQPAYDIGKEAANILFKLIEKRGNQIIPEQSVLKSILVERNSSRN